MTSRKENFPEQHNQIMGYLCLFAKIKQMERDCLASRK